MRNCIVVNLDRCSGCDSCIVACKLENGIPLGEYWNRVDDIGPFGSYPEIEKYWLPVMCQQCENPACVAVCPTGASYKDAETGVVRITRDACIGCKSCMMACPYGARTFHGEDKTVYKCELCPSVTKKGDVPACVHNCPTAARFYGDLDDPESDVSKELAKYEESAIFKLTDTVGVGPTTSYILSPSIATWQG
ncbi:4Fe-4S dicluster domain-containing protein [Denitrobacterium detoxificans]|jgi:Fe-S-cluster-containing dehydrogenase component|uniref:4Fe-4S dicluster domain-containing protein n=1 Tax=Denitrobacterium detoxificans TaxID=79604 RepID=UPI0026E9CA4C|nr:4Fe-4S dicluster domain-containing protein [Denitrobacterium detoxificans]MBE6466766.1 4Fe-4S dicluster domain-containing protein [Denitrobacterium detoxificans]